MVIRSRTFKEPGQDKDSIPLPDSSSVHSEFKPEFDDRSSVPARLYSWFLNAVLTVIFLLILFWLLPRVDTATASH